jgi:hypothetical protein
MRSNFDVSCLQPPSKIRSSATQSSTFISFAFSPSVLPFILKNTVSFLVNVEMFRNQNHKALFSEITSCFGRFNKDQHCTINQSSQRVNNQNWKSIILPYCSSKSLWRTQSKYFVDICILFVCLTFGLIVFCLLFIVEKIVPVADQLCYVNHETWNLRITKKIVAKITRFQFKMNVVIIKMEITWRSFPITSVLQIYVSWRWTKACCWLSLLIKESCTWLGPTTKILDIS